MQHDLKRLEEKADRLDASIVIIVGLGGKIPPIIHRPGWTTIAEFALVENTLDALQSQVDAVYDQYRKLIAAAELVGAEQLSASR